MRRVAGLFSVIALLLVGVGCDQDPFGVNTRTIRGEIALHRNPEGGPESKGSPIFYLVDRAHDASGFGILRGTVGRIGWNTRYILVWQNNDGGPPGWMIVDSEKKAVEGPFDEATVSADPRVQGVTPVEATAAWKKLESAT